MLRIDNTIFSLDIIEKKFVCDLGRCYGQCCRYGDAGAPLSDEEASELVRILPEIRHYLKPQGIAEIEKSGTSTVDSDGEHVTPLINNKECAYSIMDGHVYKCAIEKAWHEGHISFRKPLSCHLFPAVIKRFPEFIAVNYSEQPVCSEARIKGRKESVYVYQFLKEPLTRAFGEKMYKELCVAADEISRSRKRK